MEDVTAEGVSDEDNFFVVQAPSFFNEFLKLVPEFCVLKVCHAETPIEGGTEKGDVFFPPAVFEEADEVCVIR